MEVSLPWHSNDVSFLTLDAAGEQIPNYYEQYGVRKAWGQSKGEGIKVGFCDTGIDSTHAGRGGDLGGAVQAVRSFIDNTGGQDANGHGTHAAGITAARENGNGIVGVAPECELYVAKVLADNGSGSDRAVAQGIDWLVSHGVQVINMSLGSPNPSDAIKFAISRAVSAGVVVVVAAGNSGRQYGVNYPARWEICVAVGAVDDRGMPASFTAVGPEVDVSAPGVSILSCTPQGTYGRKSGTSMAAPFVAGMVAIIQSRAKALGKTLSPPQVLTELNGAAVDAGEKGFDNSTGHGLVRPPKWLKEGFTEPPAKGFFGGWLHMPARAGDFISIGPPKK